jgi:hypothetical protein
MLQRGSFGSLAVRDEAKKEARRTGFYFQASAGRSACHFGWPLAEHTSERLARLTVRLRSRRDRLVLRAGCLGILLRRMRGDVFAADTN